MAIAFDTAGVSAGSTGTSESTTYVTTGANPAIVVGVIGNFGAVDGIVTMTYGGASVSQIFKNPFGVGDDRNDYLFYLSGFTAGSKTLTANSTISQFMKMYISSYNGVANTGGTPNASNNSANQSASTDYTVSVTTVADNCWVAGFFNDNGGSIDSSGANTMFRSAASTSGRGMADSNAAVTPVGSRTLHITSDTSNAHNFSALAMAPVSAAGGTTPLKALLGVGI